MMWKCEGVNNHANGVKKVGNGHVSAHAPYSGPKKELKRTRLGGSVGPDSERSDTGSGLKRHNCQYPAHSLAFHCFSPLF